MSAMSAMSATSAALRSALPDATKVSFRRSEGRWYAQWFASAGGLSDAAVYARRVAALGVTVCEAWDMRADWREGSPVISATVAFVLAPVAEAVVEA